MQTCVMSFSAVQYHTSVSKMPSNRNRRAFYRRSYPFTSTDFPLSVPRSALSRQASLQGYRFGQHIVSTKKSVHFPQESSPFYSLWHLHQQLCNLLPRDTIFTHSLSKGLCSWWGDCGRASDQWHGRPPLAWGAAEGVPAVEARQGEVAAGSIKGRIIPYKVSVKNKPT